MTNNKDFPLVSIITPSFNQVEFIEETILSVLEQDYPNIEYIIVDGGSTDGSVEIIKKHSDRIAWWVSEEDEGQSDAINKGMKRAKGEFVAWLNSDDIYLAGTISQAISALQLDPELGLVYADLNSINTDGKIFNTNHYQQYELLDLLAMRIIGQPTVFMRKSVLDKVGKISSEFDYLMDHHLWIRMFQQAKSRYVPGIWASARFHSSAKNVDAAESFIADAEKIFDFALNQNDLRALTIKNRYYIDAGRQCFNAHYWLDSGNPQKALESYRHAFLNNPKMALKHWKRIFFAVLESFGIKSLRRWAYKDHE